MRARVRASDSLSDGPLSLSDWQEQRAGALRQFNEVLEAFEQLSRSDEDWRVRLVRPGGRSGVGIPMRTIQSQSITIHLR